MFAEAVGAIPLAKSLSLLELSRPTRVSPDKRPRCSRFREIIVPSRARKSYSVCFASGSLRPAFMSPGCRVRVGQGWGWGWGWVGTSRVTHIQHSPRCEFEFELGRPVPTSRLLVNGGVSESVPRLSVLTSVRLSDYVICPHLITK